MDDGLGGIFSIEMHNHKIFYLERYGVCRRFRYAALAISSELGGRICQKGEKIKIVWSLLRNLLSLLQNRIYRDIMAQLIVTVDDLELLSDLKRAIKMLRGVKDITVQKTVDVPNKTTQRAIEELKEGKTIKCRSFEEYLAKVK